MISSPSVVSFVAIAGMVDRTRGRDGRLQPRSSASSIRWFYAGSGGLDCRRRPPSTTSEVPVTKSAPARKTTAAATSSGEPTRPSSVSAARRSSWPGSTATGPGATPQTRTSGASARAKTRVNIACAAFAAQCAANEGHGWYAATSSIITTQPREARRCGAAACVTKKVPFAVAPKAASQSDSSSSSTGFAAKPSPTALTSRSRPPSSETAASTRARACPGSARSPSARPAALTLQPSCSSRREIAAPTRPVPPVTSALMALRKLCGAAASSPGYENSRRSCNRGGRPCGGGFRGSTNAHPSRKRPERRLREARDAQRRAFDPASEPEDHASGPGMRQDQLREGRGREDDDRRQVLARPDAGRQHRLPGEVEEHDQLEGHRLGQAAAPAHEGRPRLVHRQGDGGARPEGQGDPVPALLEAQEALGAGEEGHVDDLPRRALEADGGRLRQLQGEGQAPPARAHRHQQGAGGAVLHQRGKQV